MNVSHLFESLRREYAHHGLVNVLHKGALTTINHGLRLKVLKCLTLQTPDPHFLDTERRYTCTFLDREQLLALSAQSEYEISPQFLHAAFAKGDECYAILDGSVLASYGWYAQTATHVSKDLQLRCNRQYIYMFKAYTNVQYRGQRLHAVGVTRALHFYRKRGYKGLISYVEADNLPSLKSSYRMGYKNFGRVYVVKWGDRYLLWHSAGCREYDLRIAEPPAPDHLLLSSLPRGPK